MEKRKPWYSVCRNVNWCSHYGKQYGGGGLVAKVKSLSRVQLFATLWTVAHQASPSMGFSRQEYWGGLPFPSSGDLPHPGIKPRSPTLQADTLPSELCLTLATPWTIACQTHLSMGFPRQEYWSGWVNTFPSLGILPNLGIKPRSPVFQAYSLLLSHQGSPKMPLKNVL